MAKQDPAKADPNTNRAADKPVTAEKGNAPGGPDFASGDPMASGKDAVLGAQVRPETQTREDDGNRTLALPVTDPGPVLAEGVEWKHPDTSQGETLRSVNKPIPITQRHSTAPDWAGKPGHNVMQTELAPDVTGLHSVASDVYNKEKGDGLTDMAKKRNTEPRTESNHANTDNGDLPTVDMGAKENV